ncbi:MAG: histidine kinase [Bacteroidetes bacterium]|nr:histidine kinase [Bacteroidota bacterium]HRV53239.1 two-component regulator propeller domain-containing protein [Bacteroidia bacterium]
MRNRAALLFLLAFLLQLKGKADSLNIYLNYFSVQEGLSENQTTCVIKDKYGFIWVGTKDGLNRFDGRTFHVFKATTSNSIPGNYITCLSLDGDSLLWIGTTSNGFCSYDFATQKFTHYNTTNSKLNADYINDITYDSYSNCLWIAMNNSGLQKFDLEKKQVIPELVSINTYYTVAILDSTPYFGGIIESLKLLKDIGRFKKPMKDTASTLNTIYIDREGNIWCGAWDNALHLFNKNTERVNSFIFDGSGKLKLSGEEIISISEDKDNLLWCGTKNSGILIFDKKKKAFLHSIAFSRNITSRINSIYTDDFNRIWIASNEGLFEYDPLLNQFNTELMPVPEGIKSCHVVDRLITNEGLDLVISKCGMFYRKNIKEKYRYLEIVYRDEKQELNSIMQSESGKIYIGTNRTVLEFDPHTLSYKTIQSNIQGKFKTSFYFAGATVVNNLVEYTYKDSPLILASFYGMFISVIDNKRNSIYFLIHKKNHQNIILENLVRKLWVDSKKNIWICGSSMGLSQIYFDSTSKFEEVPSNDTLFSEMQIGIKQWNKAQSDSKIQIKNVYDITDADSGRYWMTTQGNGLVLFNPAHKQNPFTFINPDITSIAGISKSSDSVLWMITSSGILRYQTKSGIFKMFDANSGVREKIGGYFFNKNPFKPNEMAVGFNGGYIHFNADSMLPSLEKPVLYITKLWVMDNIADSLLISDIRLNYKNNFLKFYVSSNIYTQNNQITYYYRLNGIDKSWRSNDDNPVINYTNLPHGTYDLEVKAVTNDNIESDIRRLHFVITPPFYLTYWFYTILIIAISSIIYLLYRMRINQILRVQEVRNNLARDLHDDIGSTLGSIHLYSQIAKSKLSEKDPIETQNILDRIKVFSEEIIEKTGDTIWAVKAKNDNYSDLSLRMESYAASILGEANINFNFETDEKILDNKLTMTARKNLFLIFKEAIHNIVKYANCTFVDISLTRTGNKTVFRIADNGCGICSEKKGHYFSGNGLKNMQTRAEEIGADFVLTSPAGQGTEILITIH